MAYLPLSTANLPDPVIDPAQGSSPEDYFGIDTYTGTGTTHERSALQFQPDWTWIKERSSTSSHHIFDVIRGATKLLKSDTTQAELTSGTSLTSFDSDGFTLGGSGAVNESGQTYVAWNWKANGSGVSNTVGSITSTVSANTESGFSIVNFDTTVAAGTVGHGLSTAPELVILKNRDVADGWYVYHASLGATNGVYLHLTNASTSVSWWNSTAPTSDVFSVNMGNVYNHIAYCFHSVEGFSKFGSYTGNGSADGPFVYTGFRPAFIIAKATDVSAGWEMWDTTRDTYNVVDHRLNANSSAAESTAYAPVDILSNGFKLRDSINNWNGSGGTYIYMAFSDANGPFKYSNAR